VACVAPVLPPSASFIPPRQSDLIRLHFGVIPPVPKIPPPQSRCKSRTLSPKPKPKTQSTLHSLTLNLFTLLSRCSPILQTVRDRAVPASTGHGTAACNRQPKRRRQGTDPVNPHSCIARRWGLNLLSLLVKPAVMTELGNPRRLPAEIYCPEHPLLRSTAFCRYFSENVRSTISELGGESISVLLGFGRRRMRVGKWRAEEAGPPALGSSANGPWSCSHVSL
jgi:hypothetical protein